MTPHPMMPDPRTPEEATVPSDPLMWVGRKANTRERIFTVDACGGDAELICVLQKVMERFCEPPNGLSSDSIFVSGINPAAVAEWFYAKYGKPTR